MVEPELREDTNLYTIWDMKLEGLVLSATCLREALHTSGHNHSWIELYYCVRGNGLIERREGEVKRFQKFSVGDFAYVESNVWHRVINKGNGDMFFVCAWKENA